MCVFPDVHTEAVQAALAKHKERKMAVPMPSKRRSLVVQTSMDAYTPPGKEPCSHTSARSQVNKEEQDVSLNLHPEDGGRRKTSE